MNDYSEYLNGKTVTGQPMFDFIESQWLKFPEMEIKSAEVVNEFLSTRKIKSILEIGCGSGEVAKRIDFMAYLGVDANEKCIDAAKKKNPLKMFKVDDVRKLNSEQFDLVLSFRFLKHFSLKEWRYIFRKCASMGKYFIFDIPIGEKRDDGTEFHHVWFTLEDINEEISKAKLTVIRTVESNPDELIFITKNGI